MFIREAYAIRPYPNGQKIATISIHSASDMFMHEAYAIRPYPDERKIAMILIRPAHNDQKIAMISIRSAPNDQKIGTILIRLPHSNFKNVQILIHRQKMIPKLIGASYPRAIRKINPDAYTFLFVQKKILRAA